MADASLRFRSVREEDLDSLLVEAVPEKTKVESKYGMKIFHGKNKCKSIFYKVASQAAQAPDKITRERDSIERYNGLNL